MNLTETQGILKAAKVSKKAREILEDTFPKLFEEAKYLNLRNYTYCDNNFFQIRNGGKYKDKAFFLTDDYNWEIKRDIHNTLCLIPTKKDKK